MKENADRLNGDRFAPADEGLELRLFRVMIVAVAAAVSITAFVAPWRVTTGLLLGGLLSLFNYRWMRTSISALIDARASGKNGKANMSRFILRYLVIAAVVIAAYMFHTISLPATIIGLCSFVVALFAEAGRQFYFTIVKREGIN